MKRWLAALAALAVTVVLALVAWGSWSSYSDAAAVNDGRAGRPVLFVKTAQHTDCTRPSGRSSAPEHCVIVYTGNVTDAGRVLARSVTFRGTQAQALAGAGAGAPAVWIEGDTWAYPRDAAADTTTPLVTFIVALLFAVVALAVTVLLVKVALE